MYSHPKLAFLCAFLYAVWAPDVTLADDDEEPPTWSIFQFDRMDDLFIQIRKAELQTKPRVAPDFQWLIGVCNSIDETPAFQSVTRNNLETDIRGGLTPSLDPLPPNMIFEPNYAMYQPRLKRYNLEVPNVAVFSLDLYECASDATGAKYSLSHGYEQDSVFFLFAHDPVTGAVSLRAIVQEDAKVRTENMDTLMWSFVVRRHAFLTVFKKATHARSVGVEDDPICTLSDADKLRLCSMVLDTPYYSSEYQFTPKIENVGACSSFTLQASSVFSQNIDQLMFPCTATSLKNPSQTFPIYISRNYVRNGVTSFTDWNAGRYIVEPGAFFKNIFFVSEPYEDSINTQVKLTAQKNKVAGVGDGANDGGYAVGTVAQSDMADAAAAMVSISAISTAMSSMDGDGDGGGGDGGK